MITHFLVHDKADTVGVVVVENLQPGQALTGWIYRGESAVIGNGH